MAIIVIHISDSHIKSSKDILLKRIHALSGVVVGEFDASVKSIIIAFTGDVIDKGTESGFEAANRFFLEFTADIQKQVEIKPELLLIPGNHDLVASGDQSVRDMLIGGLTAEAVIAGLKPAVEQELLKPLAPFFGFASTLAPSATIDQNSPFYLTVDRVLDGKQIRFHLVNSSWMCYRSQKMGTLLFPIDKFKPTNNGFTPDYEISLIHHPLDWFKQPEIMRPLREVIESNSDLILTGHEHVGRLTKTEVHGQASHEYREGDALQEGVDGKISGFHILRLDFELSEQHLTTYQWNSSSVTEGYVRTLGPVINALGKNLQRINQESRLSTDFKERLDDSELPVTHSKQGKLRLTDFFIYPDIMELDKKNSSLNQRIKGEEILQTIKHVKRVLLVGPDRCGKSSLAKKLFADLHKGGFAPLFAMGKGLKVASAGKINRHLESLVKQQYELLQPELYWQLPAHQRVLIIDDLHNGPADHAERELFLEELERVFEYIIVVGALEFLLEDLFSPESSSKNVQSRLWKYNHYRILPFGHVRCDQFVRKWVSLDRSQSSDQTNHRVLEISGALRHFLKNNPIPQFPWVVLIIVQLADVPDLPYAENGSYGHLLQALITAALAKSRLKLPVNGKYRWLSELANKMHVEKRSTLSDREARELHEVYRREYGVLELEYSAVRDDLTEAGVLRFADYEISFRQSYTYCYFVAWHLSQRIHANDETARADVYALCKNLYHEDTANVLVFLAHLTPSHTVLDAMIAHASELFSDSTETDFASDVVAINSLYGKGQLLSLPSRGHDANKQLLQEKEDSKSAEVHSKTIAPNHATDHNLEDKTPQRRVDTQKVMDIVTSLRTIEILGQVLRNEATARRVPEMLATTDHVFRLGRRLLGFIFTQAGEQLDSMIGMLGENYKQYNPNAKKEDIDSEVSRQLFNRYLFTAFSVIKFVSAAVGERNLREVFRQLVDKDPNLPNQFYKLSIDLEIDSSNVSINDLTTLNAQLTGKTKNLQGKREYNNLAHTLLRALIYDHMYLNYVSHQRSQALCSLLGIRSSTRSQDINQKRLPPKK